MWAGRWQQLGSTLVQWRSHRLLLKQVLRMHRSLVINQRILSAHNGCLRNEEEGCNCRVKGKAQNHNRESLALPAGTAAVGRA